MGLEVVSDYVLKQLTSTGGLYDTLIMKQQCLIKKDKIKWNLFIPPGKIKKKKKSHSAFCISSAAYFCVLLEWPPASAPARLY